MADRERHRMESAAADARALAIQQARRENLVAKADEALSSHGARCKVEQECKTKAAKSHSKVLSQAAKE